MPITTINLSMNCTIGELVAQISNFLGTNLTPSNFTRFYRDGGVFLSSLNSNGWVIAAYNHPSKSHSAIADGGSFGGGTDRAEAEPGIWAVAASKAGINGKKTYYNTY